MNYFRYQWNDTRGDEFNDWGISTYWFEMGNDGYVTRQMEVYENGIILKYDYSHTNDEYGFLADQPLEPWEIEIIEIPFEEFEHEWSKTKALNFP